MALTVSALCVCSVCGSTIDYINLNSEADYHEGRLHPRRCIVSYIRKLKSCSCRFDEAGFSMYVNVNEVELRRNASTARTLFPSYSQSSFKYIPRPKDGAKELMRLVTANRRVRLWCMSHTKETLLVEIRKQESYQSRCREAIKDARTTAEGCRLNRCIRTSKGYQEKAEAQLVKLGYMLMLRDSIPVTLFNFGLLPDGLRKFIGMRGVVLSVGVKFLMVSFEGKKAVKVPVEFVVKWQESITVQEIPWIV